MTEDNSSLNSSEYLHNFYRIPAAAGQEILYPDKEGQQRNELFLGVLLGSFILDQQLRDFTQDNFYAGDNTLSEFLYNIGTMDAVIYSLGGFYTWSWLTEDSYLQDTVLLSLQSLILTQLTTEFLKNTVNRQRPRNSPDAPFTRSRGSQSFISGHASGSWAILTVIANRYPQTEWFAYGLATAVAASRIYEDAHWLSDVVAGVAVGYGFANLTLDLNKSSERKVSLFSVIREQEAGLYVSYKF